LDILTALANKSLVLVEREQGQETRYRLLETVRQYAHEQLSESGEADAIRTQHLTCFLDLARRAEPEVQGAGQVLWFNRLEVELDNIRAALEWSLEGAEKGAEMGLRMASHLWWFWFMRGYPDGGEWLEKTLLASQASTDLVTRATALSRLGWVRFFDDAHADEGLRLGQTLGPAGRESVALALLGKGAWAFYQADYARAKSLLEESLGLFREIGYRFGICEAQTWLGMALINLGDYQQAKARLAESLALARKARDGNEIGFAVWQLGRAAMFQGDYAQAATLMQEGVATYRGIKQLGGVTFLLDDLGKAALLEGDYQQAVSYFKESLSMYWKSGYERKIAFGLEQLASVAVADRQPEQAARLLGAAQALREASGAAMHPYQLAEYERSLESLRSQLDEATFAAQWTAGRAMTMEQAVVYALKETDA
jgi:tetratricopeptide (TPR) repeat protein